MNKFLQRYKSGLRPRRFYWYLKTLGSRGDWWNSMLFEMRANWLYGRSTELIVEKNFFYLWMHWFPDSGEFLPGGVLSDIELRDFY